MKTCCRCKILLPLESFGKCCTQKDGLSRRCRKCHSAANSAYRSKPDVKEKNRVYNSAWHALPEHREKAKQRSLTPEFKDAQKKYRNRPSRQAEIKEYQRKYQSRPEVKERRRSRWASPEARARRKLYKVKPERKERRRKYLRDRFASDVQFRLAINMRNRLCSLLRGKIKAGSATRDLGCSIEDLKRYLESKFQPGMTWENWGKDFGTWQIDHIIPLSQFDLTNREHLLLACHYTNLQPLWFEENSSKRHKMPLLDVVYQVAVAANSALDNDTNGLEKTQ